MQSHVTEMYLSMQNQLKGITDHNSVQSINQKLKIVNETITRLKSFIIHYSFQSPQEEIHFFKHLKPQFYRELLLYKKLLDIEICRPVSCEKINEFYKKELEHISCQLDKKRLWLTYYRSGATNLDDQYFLRNTDLVNPAFILTADTRFCTTGSINFSRIQYYELLAHILENKIVHQDQTTVDKSLQEDKVISLKWNGPKVGLVEFGYACKEAGIFNESLEKIFETFEKFFIVHLDNTSRTFQEILSRKIEEKTFLSKLDAKLKDRKDRIHQNYSPRK